MTTPNAPSYKAINDVPYAVIEAMLREKASPMHATSSATHAAAQPHSALFWAQGWLENQWQLTGHIIRPHHHNPLSLRPWPGDPRGMPGGATGTVTAPDGGQFLVFVSDAACAKEWKRRLFDDPAYKGGIYRNAVTLEQMLNIYAPPGDVHPVTGKDNADIGYAATVRTVLQRFVALESTQAPTEGTTMAITFGRVPMYGYVDKTYIAKNKREGVGWDNLGARKPKFIAVHRMLGSLNSTESYFAPANSPHLTDFAIGVASIDGKDRAGQIDQYNDPLGYKSGWASGRVSKPYGDGKAIIDKYGINAVNRDGISMEISGHQTTPVDDVAWAELVWFCAYWCDWMKIPHTSIPTNPATGISAFIWHQEFTIGTGKECPFRWMMDNTSRLIRDTAAFMKRYQEGASADPVVPPPAVPKPEPSQYATPSPIAALVDLADDDADKIAAVVTDEANRFYLVNDLVRATRDTKRAQYAVEGAKSVGPDIKQGGEFDVTWLIHTDDADWYVTPAWSRVLVSDTERISDSKAA